MFRTKYIIRALFLCSFWSCTNDNQKLSHAEYIKYVKNPNNEFFVKHLKSDLVLEAFFLPPTYFSLINLKKESVIEENLINEIEKNTMFYHFNFSINAQRSLPIDEMLKKDLGSENQSFASKKNHLLYGMQNSFSLVTEKDSLPCIFFLAQPSGNIDNALHFFLAFEANSAIDIEHLGPILRLDLQDSILAPQKISFTFDTEKINQSPKFKM